MLKLYQNWGLTEDHTTGCVLLTPVPEPKRVRTWTVEHHAVFLSVVLNSQHLVPCTAPFLRVLMKIWNEALHQSGKTRLHTWHKVSQSEEAAKVMLEQNIQLALPSYPTKKVTLDEHVRLCKTAANTLDEHVESYEGGGLYWNSIQPLFFWSRTILRPVGCDRRRYLALPTSLIELR